MWETLFIPISRFTLRLDLLDHPGVRWLNTVLSNVKPSLDGTYHALKFRTYIHRYLAEAAWRFSHRFDLKIFVPRLLVAVALCKLLARVALTDHYAVSNSLTLARIRFWYSTRNRPPITMQTWPPRCVRA